MSISWSVVFVAGSLQNARCAAIHGSIPMKSSFVLAVAPRVVGYRGFLSLIWMLFQQNRKARRLNLRTKSEIELPVRWTR